MKKTISLLLCLAMALALAACGPSDEEIKAVRSVAFEGTELTVTLGTNKSTGYEWKFEIHGDCIKQSVNRSFKITGSHGDATGEVSIGFEGLSAGDAVIVLTTPEPTPEIELLSAPYARMLMSWDYQYTYPVDVQGTSCRSTVAAKDGIAARRVTADDGSYSGRNIFIDGQIWSVNDQYGTVSEMAAENAAMLGVDLPDYGASLTFAGSNTLENGTIGEAYDYEHNGQTCSLVFIFLPDGSFVGIIQTEGGNTIPMDILEMTSPADESLFDVPQ